VNGFSVSQVSTFTIFGDAPAAVNVSVSGQVLTPDGRVLRNASVTMTDPVGTRRTAITSSFGVYTFENVPVGQVYTMSVSSKRYRFATRFVTVDNNLTAVDFVGLE